MADLSPAAQAVLDAFLAEWNDCFLQQDSRCIAAALRTAVAHTQQRQYNECWICDANELLAIAAELQAKALPGPALREPGCDKTSTSIDQ